MTRSLLIAGLLFLLAAPCLADDAAQANRLMIEAVKLVQESEREPSAEGKLALLTKAHDHLVAIIERHPSTDLAVKLATGQRIGSISLRAVREAMDRARIPEPRKPGAPVKVWRHEAGVVALALPSGRRWAWTAAEDGIVALRDLGTGALLRTWQHRGRLKAAAMSPRGRRVLTAGRNRSATLREAGTGRVLSEWEHERPITSAALSRDGKTALVGAGHAALLIDVDALEIRRIWKHRAPVTAVASSADGRWILAGFADGKAVLGEARTGRVVYEWRHEGSGGGGVTSAAFSADGRRVLTGAANTTAVLRDVATGRTLHKWQVGRRVTAVAGSADGRWVLTGDDGYEVELHDGQTGRTLRKWRYDTRPEAVAFSPNGRQAFMGFADGVAILCDIRLPESRRRYERTRLTRDGGCW